MKAVTPIVAVVLVMLVMISITGIGILFITTATDSAKGIVSQQSPESGGVARIDHVSENAVYIYSAGRQDVQNPSFFVNDQKVDATGPTTVTPGQMVRYDLDPDQLGQFPDIAEVKVTTANSVDSLVAQLRQILPRIIGMGTTFYMGEVAYAQAGLIIFRDSSNKTDLMAITDAGRVGIGTINPDGFLEIKDDSGQHIKLTSGSTPYAGGMWLGGQGFLRIGNWTTPANTIRINLSSGYVGIAGINPTEMLDVGGRIKGTELCIGTDCRASWPAGGGGGGAAGWTTTATAVYNNTNGVNVGIGTAAPQRPLHISSSTPTILLENTASGVNQKIRFISSSAGDFVIGKMNDGGVSPVTHLAVKTNGFVGIGTTAPKTLLDSRGALNLQDGNSAGVLYYPSTGAIPFFFIRSDDDPSTYEVTSERLFIGSAGNVGIGMTNPAAKLQVAGNVRNSAPSQGYLELSGDLPGYPVNTYPVLKASGPYIYFSAGGVYSAYMTATGVFTGVSSRESKENFIALDSDHVLQRIKSLPVQQWNFKIEDDAIRHIGPTAEDFHAAFGLNGNSTKMIASSDVAGVALLGTKVLLEKVERQQKEIDELKAQIKELKENP